MCCPCLTYTWHHGVKRVPSCAGVMEHFPEGSLRTVLPQEQREQAYVHHQHRSTSWTAEGADKKMSNVVGTRLLLPKDKTKITRRTWAYDYSRTTHPYDTCMGRKKKNIPNGPYRACMACGSLVVNYRYLVFVTSSKTPEKRCPPGPRFDD